MALRELTSREIIRVGRAYEAMKSGSEPERSPGRSMAHQPRI